MASCRPHNRKIRLALVFGGQSAEHEVSLASARSILRAVDPAQYEILPIAITQTGRWIAGAPAIALLAPPESPELPGSGGSNGAGPTGVAALAAGITSTGDVMQALSPAASRRKNPGDSLDVVFPVLHGPHGEDGTVQGLLELAGIPYVGAGVAASSVGMDKILMKRLFMQAGLPVLPFVAATRTEWRADPGAVARRVAEIAGFPCFVKPANMGSSLGISRAANPDELVAAMDEAARYDRRLMVERAAPEPRELECGILGNDAPDVSVVGEIRVLHADYYDYDAKYRPGGSELVVPAELAPAIAERVQDLATQAFLAVDGAGMARVDFFLCADNALYVSEINTIPGFTPTSMFPRLWAASGVPYARLIDRLVELALERHAT